MSKTRERAEKICLNCNSELYGRYCHVCGQENKEPKESVWYLITHFFYDITHFDGKFFSTLKYLIRKPGFLSSEYIKGRRNSYLNPIRMYVFTSALFFLVFFSLFTVKDVNKTVGNKTGFMFDKETIENMRSRAYEGAENKEDSLRIDSAISEIGQAVLLRKDNFNREDSEDKKDSGDKKDPEDKKIKTKVNTNSGFNISGWMTGDTMTLAQYDSIQKALPEEQKNSWIKHQLKRRELSIKGRYRDNYNQFWTDVLNKFIHTFPYMLFISLPLYALYLKLLYIRRKQFYYVDHGIFLLHLYIFTFLFMLVYFMLDKLGDSFNWGWMTVIKVIMFLYGIYYTYRSMKNFYKQGFFKTFTKFCLLNLMAFISLMILFTFFFAFSILQL